MSEQTEKYPFTEKPSDMKIIIKGKTKKVKMTIRDANGIEHQEIIEIPVTSWRDLYLVENGRNLCLRIELEELTNKLKEDRRRNNRQAVTRGEWIYGEPVD